MVPLTVVCFIWVPHIFWNKDSIFWKRRHGQPQCGTQRSPGVVNKPTGHLNPQGALQIIKKIKPTGPEWETASPYVWGQELSLTLNSGRTVGLHKGHGNLAQKTLLWGNLPSNCRLNLGLLPPLLLILLTKGDCFKTTYVSLSIFALKALVSLCIPNYVHCLLWPCNSWKW